MIIQNLMTSTKVTLIIPILTYDILMQDENEALCMGTLLEPRMLSCNYVITTKKCYFVDLIIMVLSTFE